MTLATRLLSLLLFCCTSLSWAESGDLHIDVSIDNDLFSGSGEDRDYTGGIRATFWRDLDASWQAGLLVFGPDLNRIEPAKDDRPYANLLFLARTKTSLSQNVLRHRTWSLGLLGTQLGTQAQRTIHRLTSSEIPDSLDEQISDGGEITGRIGVDSYRPLFQAQLFARPLSVVSETSWSLGYQTDISGAIGFRLGGVQDWSDVARDFLPHLDQPARLNTEGRYLFGGARLRAVGHNSLLQGQFRSSARRFDRSEIRRGIGEAWLGAAVAQGPWLASYTINYKTSEVRTGAADRDQLSAAISLSYRFDRR